MSDFGFNRPSNNNFSGDYNDLDNKPVSIINFNTDFVDAVATYSEAYKVDAIAFNQSITVDDSCEYFVEAKYTNGTVVTKPLELAETNYNIYSRINAKAVVGSFDGNVIDTNNQMGYVTSLIPIKYYNNKISICRRFSTSWYDFNLLVVDENLTITNIYTHDNLPTVDSLPSTTAYFAIYKYYTSSITDVDSLFSGDATDGGLYIKIKSDIKYAGVCIFLEHSEEGNSILSNTEYTICEATSNYVLRNRDFGLYIADSMDVIYPASYSETFVANDTGFASAMLIMNYSNISSIRVYTKNILVNEENKELATKEYVDDSLPSIEKFKLVSSTTHNLDFDNLTYSNGNTKAFCYPTNMPTSGDHYVKYTLASSDGVYTGTKQEANGDPIILKLTEGKAYTQGTLTVDSIPNFSISFNRTITFNDDGTFKQYSFDPNTSMVFCRFVDGDGYPRQWTITIEFYEIDNNCASIKYNIPDNLENGTGSYSLQQVGNNATGSNSVALGNLNEGPGYLLGYGNKATGTAISIGKGNDSTGASYVLGEGNTVASGFAIGVNNKAEGVTTVVGNGLTSTTPKSQNKGSMIIGAGGTLAQDTLFAISTGLRTENASTYHTVRYPFEAKEDGTTYLRGANVVLESENEPSADNHLVTKKYVDEAVASVSASAVNAVSMDYVEGLLARIEALEKTIADLTNNNE